MVASQSLAPLDEPHGPAAGMPRSLVRVVAERAYALPDAIRLVLGEPGIDTPAPIVAAAAHAAASGATRYTANAGLAALREAVAAKVARVNGYAVTSDEVVVGAGGVQILFACLSLLAGSGDDVLIPDPSWPDYRMMCHLLGVEARAYAMDPARGYLPDPDEIASLIGPRTRALVLNSPSNPLGRVTPPELTERLLAVAERNDLWVISDECYDELAFDAKVTASRLLCSPAQAARTISLYSLSKVHAMTGWRVGYAVVPPAVAPHVANVQEPLVSCVNTPAQHAAIAALTGSQEHVGELRETFRRRRDLVCDALRAAGIAHQRPDGAFYVWVELGDVARDTLAWSLELLSEHGVAVAPGEAFGERGAGCVRVSLSVPEDELACGIGRLVEKATAGGAGDDR
jgi:aspartate aminotransferase